MYIKTSRELQQTILQDIVFSGIGVHSGQAVEITLKPAPANHGIVFSRIDLHNNGDVKVAPENISTVSGGMCTTLKNINGVCIKTPEHLLAAIWGVKLDNVLIEINAEEVPIMDGSSIIFYEKIIAAGLVEQDDAYRHYLIIEEELKITYQDTEITAMPSDNFYATANIQFLNDHGKLLFKCSSNFDETKTSFRHKLADAHTFALRSWEKYKKLAIAGVGADMNNTIIVEDLKEKNFANIVNPDILRRSTYAEECADHKPLDFIGDLMLLGIHVKGKFHLSKPGHFINSLLVKHLYKQLQNLPITIFKLQQLDRKYG